MRNNDNYQNAYQYIKDQLFVYNYNNTAHRHILKLKFWSLDADIMEEEKLPDGSTPDKDVLNPMDHKQSLANELYFLDLYRRTVEKLLGKNEQPFKTVVANRKSMMNNWIKQKNPLTGEIRKDYEMAYTARPLLMTEREIQELYTLYKVKEANGELSNCLEITTKITEDNIDTRKYLAELAILNYVMPADSEQQMYEQALKLKLAEDDDLVVEINNTKQKIIEDCIKPSLVGISNITPVPPAMQRIDPIDIVAVNMVSDRVSIIAQRHGPASNRKGFINEYENPPTGGYRYPVNTTILRVWKVGRVEVDYTVIPGETDPETGTAGKDTYEFNSYSIVPINPFTSQDVNTAPGGQNTFTANVPISQNQVEKNWDTFSLAILYSSPIISGGTGTEPGTQVGTATSLTKAPVTIDAVRFNELNARWTNFNIFREHKLDDIGLRLQIETMFDTDVPYILPKLEKQLKDLKEEKDHVINVLREDCLFSEFI